MSEAPKRIQRKRTKGWRKPEGAVIVDRTSRWGNPFKVSDLIELGYYKEGNEFAFRDVVDCYEAWLGGDRSEWMGPESDAAAARILSGIEELRGKDLACFCPLDLPCHADVLLELANQHTEDQSND